MGMTMKRSEKAQHQAALVTTYTLTSGAVVTGVKHASPVARERSFQEGRGFWMTPAEYKEGRMRRRATCPIMAVDEFRETQRKNKRRKAR